MLNTLFGLPTSTLIAMVLAIKSLTFHPRLGAQELNLAKTIAALQQLLDLLQLSARNDNPVTRWFANYAIRDIEQQMQDALMLQCLGNCLIVMTVPNEPTV